MNGVHNIDFKDYQNNLFNSNGNVSNAKLNELNLNAAMFAILATTENNQTMLNGLTDNNLFNSQSTLNNPFFNYLRNNQNLFTSGSESNTNQQQQQQQQSTNPNLFDISSISSAFMIQNGLTNGTTNGGFDTINSINSLFKPVNGMLGM